MKIRPFQAWRPPPALAGRVACVPYDVVNTAEARALAQGNSACFLHVTRPDIDLPDDAAPEAQYRGAAEAWRRFRHSGYLAQDAVPGLYLYRLTMGTHSQLGLVATVAVSEYESQVIRRHELTRVDKEEDRARHIDTVDAQTGPVFLTHADEAALAALALRGTAAPPEVDFVAADGVRHQVWPVRQAEPWVAALENVPCCYIADGHHRAASAARVAARRRALRGGAPGGLASDWFLAALFPAGQLNVLSYNRCVKDLNGRDAAALLRNVRERFHVTEDAGAQPAAPRDIRMFLAGRWQALRWDDDTSAADPVAALDVSVLQDRLLAPLLGIDDPRTSKRIDFVGGIRGVAELERRVRSGEAAVAFSMFPTTVMQMMRVADVGRVMPPKSTWFEPKLRCGLFVHDIA